VQVAASGGVRFLGVGAVKKTHVDLTATRRQVRTRQALLSILPIVVVLLAIRAYPIITAVMKSLTNWDGLFKSDYVGFENYIRLLTGSMFWILIRNNFVLLINVPVQVFLGLIVAVLLHERVWGWRFFRALYYIPQIISAVIIGYLFRTLFSMDGPINIVLSRLGVMPTPLEWLGNAGTALSVIIFTLVWSSLGWIAIVFMGGLTTIPESVFEAARIDGAGFWRRTFQIAVPLLVRVLEYAVMLSVVWTFTGLFPFIFSMTRGGPGYETTTLDYMIYIKSFVSGVNLGEACALAVLLLLIILGLTAAQLRLTNRLDDWTG
jgi:raffinose/stachyose/melibiose transport system permease protein